MKEKKYKSIKEVSKLLNINTHVIRYWDSKFGGLSTRISSKKQRFFNNENIKKIENLKKIIYRNGKQNNTFDIASIILNDNKYLRENKDNLLSNIKDFENQKHALSASKDLNLQKYIENLINIKEKLKKILN